MSLFISWLIFFIVIYINTLFYMRKKGKSIYTPPTLRVNWGSDFLGFFVVHFGLSGRILASRVKQVGLINVLHFGLINFSCILG